MSSVYTPHRLPYDHLSHTKLQIDRSYHMLSQHLTTISNYAHYGSIEQNIMAAGWINSGMEGNYKVKTSLCRKWIESRNCPYGYRCQFAHGIKELRCNVGEISYKTKQCIAFTKKGYCPYGDRCNFLHKELKNFDQDSQRSNKQNQTDFMCYRQIIQEGKIFRNKRSRLLDILKKDPQQSDHKSVASTEQSKSQNLSKSRIQILQYDLLHQVSEQKGCDFSFYGSNAIYGNIAQVNIYNSIYGQHLSDQQQQETDNSFAQQVKQEVENEGIKMFNIDQFY